MRRRDFIALSSAAAAFPRVVFAQQVAKVPRVAVLGLPLVQERRDAIVQGLAAHGYVDGKTVVIDWALAPTTNDIPAYASMAVAAMPDVIMCSTTPAVQSAKNLTRTIPIVMTGLNDPVGNGLVDGLAHPGGNVTGSTNSGPDLVGKQLGLLKELVPRLSRLAVLDFPADPSAALYVGQVRAAAQTLGVEPVVIDFIETQDFGAQLERIAASNVQAFYITAATYFVNQADALFRYEVTSKIPQMAPDPSAVPFTGVIAYAANRPLLYRQATDYVDAILKGVKPGDLPVQEPTMFDLAVNTATAKAVGLTIPTSILARATIVVDEDYRTAR